jgi:hypothetical protein
MRNLDINPCYFRHKDKKNIIIKDDFLISFHPLGVCDTSEQIIGLCPHANLIPLGTPPPWASAPRWGNRKGE